MDLYKYRLEKETDSGSIYLYDTKQADKLLKDINVEYSLEFDYDIEKLTKDLFNLDFDTIAFSWNLGIDEKFIGLLKGEVIDKINLMSEECQKLFDIDYDKFLEIVYELDLLLEKIENNREKYTEKIFYLSAEDLEPYITDSHYVIKNKKIEIGYVRKPFRFSSTPFKRTVDEDGNATVTCFIDNTTGVNEELYNEMKKHCYYDEEYCQMIFTSKSTRANDLLEKCINSGLTGVSELFPINDNEIIEIDW